MKTASWQDLCLCSTYPTCLNTSIPQWIRSITTMFLMIFSIHFFLQGVNLVVMFNGSALFVFNLHRRLRETVCASRRCAHLGTTCAASTLPCSPTMYRRTATSLSPWRRGRSRTNRRKHNKSRLDSGFDFS